MATPPAEAASKPQPRIFESKLTGARVTLDLYEEEGELDYRVRVDVNSHWPARWMILHMANHGGFTEWSPCEN